MEQSGGLRRAAAAALVCGGAWLNGCAADPSKPTDAALTCPQILQEIASEDATEKLSERRAGELRGTYYAYQTATLIPFVGDVMSITDQVSDASHSRELDHLNEDARDARHRRDYLIKMQTTRCPGAAAAI
jgi:hypothetical protein